MAALTKTALYDLHTNLKARMVPFAGYEMPVQYPIGTIKEHLHCRTQAGFFDISHMGQCFISGNHVAEQLEKLTPAKLSSLSVNRQLYTVLTNTEGGVIDDIMITRLASKFQLIVNAGCKHKVFKHLKAKLSTECQIEERPKQALFALQGPKASEVMQQLSKTANKLKFMHATETDIHGITCIISRSGYTGEDGFEISVANNDAERLAKLFLSFEQVMPIGLGARDTLRLEAGLSLYGHELNESLTPVDSGLSWLVRGRDNYLGSAKIQHQLTHGANKKKIGLHIEGKIPVRENNDVYDQNNNVVGVVSSGSFSPSLGKPIAIALINSDSSDATFYAQIRNHIITMHRVELPFVKHRYHGS
jgi:glycine cleavage system T protein (aminomethyltransferase)